MKRLAFFLSFLLTLAGCSSGVLQTSSTPASAAVIKTQSSIWSMVWNTQLTQAVRQTEARVGKTWYVFSGDTPAGWDCSGLVRWTYQQVGITLPHSANKQGHLGYWVKTPQIGDVVVFGYPGTNTFYHSAIYIGNGWVVHAGFHKGMATAKISLKDPSFKGSVIRFVRITPPA